MKYLFFFALFLSKPVLAVPEIQIQPSDHVFVKISVPKNGIVSSNRARIERLSKVLDKVSVYDVPWGPQIYTGEYKGQKVFMASAPVGSGSGLMFTELYAAGAEYIIRYGSDDVKSPQPYEKEIVKIIDETDNLYGYALASAVPEDEWGKSVFASDRLLKALREEAKMRNLAVEERVCHHLENYHALRTPQRFSPERRRILEDRLAQLKRKDKKESFDMESAVLFRVAKDCGKHAAAVLQTVNKEDPKQGAYEGKNKEESLKMEAVFVDYILSALLKNR